jgi:hypothetical protein
MVVPLPPLPPLHNNHNHLDYQYAKSNVHPPEKHSSMTVQNQKKH